MKATYTRTFMDTEGDFYPIHRLACTNEDCLVKPSVASLGPWGYKAHQEWWNENFPGRYFNTEDEAQSDVLTKWNHRPPYQMPEWKRKVCQQILSQPPADMSYLDAPG